MRDTNYYYELQQSLEKSYQKKKGKWSSPKEVGVFTDQPVNLTSMRELVKKGMAVEKRPNMKVFKPRKGAAGEGAFGFPQGFDPYRSPEGWSDPYRSPEGWQDPRGTPPNTIMQPYDDSGPRGTPPSATHYTASAAGQGRRTGRGKPSDSIGQGIGLSIAGGIASAPVAAAVPSATSGSIATHILM